jgi:hypothetical protein
LWIHRKKNSSLRLGSRGVVGQHIAALSSAYELPVENGLASIVPRVFPKSVVPEFNLLSFGVDPSEAFPMVLLPLPPPSLSARFKKMLKFKMHGSTPHLF